MGVGVFLLLFFGLHIKEVGSAKITVLGTVRTGQLNLEGNNKEW